MAPHPQPLPGPSTASRKKEPVKFSTLDNPPRANLLPPAALLSLLCLAFLCLVFVCFRHTEWIVTARKKIWRLIREQAVKLSDWFAEFKYNRQRRIKLIEEAEEEEEEEEEVSASLGAPTRALSNTDRLQSLNLSHHHQHLHQQQQQQQQLRSHLLSVAGLPDNVDQEELDEDNEVLPQVLYSK